MSKSQDESADKQEVNPADPNEKKSIASEIERGKELVETRKKRYSRCICKSTRWGLNPLYKKLKVTACPIKAATIWRWVYPRPPKYKECNHAHSGMKFRELMTRKEHINELSIPRQRVKPKSPYCIQRNIDCGSFRLAELSEPKRKHVIETLTSYDKILSKERKENLKKYLYRLNYVYPLEAARFYKQQKRDRKMIDCRAKRNISTLRKKINREQSKMIKDAILTIYRTKFKPYLLSTNSPQKHSGQSGEWSKKILEQICRFDGVPVPEQNSDDPTERNRKNVADKMTVWMLKFLQACGFNFHEPGHMYTNGDDPKSGTIRRKCRQSKGSKKMLKLMLAKESDKKEFAEITDRTRAPKVKKINKHKDEQKEEGKA